MSTLKKELVTLDVSFIRDYLKRIANFPIEISLVSNYSLNVSKEHNTIVKFKEHLKRKLGVTTDAEMYSKVNKRLVTKTSLKVKSIIDSMIFKEFGNDVMEATFVEFIDVKKDIIIRLEISR